VDTQISGPVRLVAIIGFVAALAGGGGMMILSRGAADIDQPIPPVQASSVLPNPAQAKPEPKAKAPVPAPAPAPEPAPKKAEPPPVVDANGLPISISAALQRYEVVVVSLFTPAAAVDNLVLEEARAGARAAGAGFVALNVLDPKQGMAIARLLGVTEPPATLVYQSPATLAFRLDGFSDFETVAQAAVNAGAPGGGEASRFPDSWSREANALCAEANAASPQIPAGASTKEIAALGPSILAPQRRLLSGLQKLKLPSDPGRRTLASKFVDAIKQVVASEEKLIASLKTNDLEAGLPALGADLGSSAEAGGLARQLRLPACQGSGS
jgi:hypothetical protein